LRRNFYYTSEEPIVRLTCGKLHGYQMNDIYHFLGIRYAQAKRFQMPVSVRPWDGVKEAVNYGYSCPTLTPPSPVGEAFTPAIFWPRNEHCQYLNIWTPQLNRDARKPVMVWMHGGGYTEGSANDSVVTQGENLAAYGDVVVVSVNHRTNILGFFDLSEFGAKYENSVNAGIADLVQALLWIRENIEAFGGDPDNVTIFGQSGGGGKVATLLQVPEAAGLFHKAIIMSGIADSVEEAQDGEHGSHRMLARQILEELGAEKTQIGVLEEVPYTVLARAFGWAAKTLWQQKNKLIEWGPQANHWFLGNPMQVGFTEYAKHIPVIAGSTLAEHSRGPVLSGREPPSAKRIHDLLTEKFGAHAQRLAGMFAAAYPDKNPLGLLRLESQFRIPTLDYVKEKARVSCAAVYCYLFALEYDHARGRIAPHGADVAFAFHNIDKIYKDYISGVSERLEDQLCGAFVSFAKTGNPNRADLPVWKAVGGDGEATMVFDTESKTREKYDSALLEALRAAAPGEKLNEMFAGMHGYDKPADDKIWRY